MAAIVAFQKKYGSQPGLKWVPFQNLHLTLLFIGHVKDESVPHLISSLDILAATSPFILQFQNFDLRKRNGRPNMIWCRYASNPDFIKLTTSAAAAVREAIQFQPEKRKPIPHITFARIKPVPEQHLGPLPDYPVPDLVVDKLVLWESKLAKPNALYSPLHSIYFYS